MPYPFRTRFAKDIVAEFLPPRRKQKKDRVIILCEGLPGVPGKDSLMNFLSARGYWVILPRYRGTWESGGKFLKLSPHQDVLDILKGLSGVITESTFGRKFPIKAKEIFVIGGSFGGAAALLASLDSRIRKVVAICPVVDWKATKESEKAETSNPDYADFLKQAFGEAYRFPKKNWKKLSTGRFYNPIYRVKDFDRKKILMIHAKDDPVIPWLSVQTFAKTVGCEILAKNKGGHLSLSRTVQKDWRRISKFLK